MKNVSSGNQSFPAALSHGYGIKLIENGCRCNAWNETVFDGHCSIQL